MKIEIEHGIPVPHDERCGDFIELFTKLKPGDSMFIYCEDGENPGELSRRLGLGPLRHFIGRYISRKTTEGVRVWKK